MNFELFHLQIMTGGLPYMTKGPLAMFFGGHDILPELSDRKAGRHTQILCLVSVVFNLSISNNCFHDILRLQEVSVEENFQAATADGDGCRKFPEHLCSLCHHHPPHLTQTWNLLSSKVQIEKLCSRT